MPSELLFLHYKYLSFMNPNDIIIRKVTPSEIDQLLAIGQMTFKETFQAVNSEENMQTYLDSSFSPEKLAIELTDQNSEFILPSYKAT